ncbi:ParA family protein [Rhizobium sp. SL86]|uniref:ParA family protein n=1 Tax=Rhizobium sp. SL86 TaxID=2995148 RepID=UPI002275E2F7|nr:ParA family protein [Rhizobium sp. SL86]MCY1667371.1 ParA family protein [Rhizobium sp. SL86]
MTVVFGTLSGKGGAGKSTLVTLLAGEYASYDKKVLLVDADPSQNLAAWWRLSEEKENQPENVDLASVLQRQQLAELLDRKKAAYDVVIIDTAGRESIFGASIIGHCDLVLTPIQASKREIDAAGTAAQHVAEFNAEHGTDISQLIVRTRVALTSKSLEAYSFIRPFVEALRNSGAPSILLETELMERNVYRNIQNGYGSVQMQDLTEPVIKARREIMSLVKEIDSHLPPNMRKAA